MPRISVRYPPPDGDRDFERLCLLILRRHWGIPELQLYGRRGQAQDGVDILDVSGQMPLRAAQCKNHDPLITITPSEIDGEVQKARNFHPPLGLYLILTTAKPSTEAQQKIIELNRKHRRKRLFAIDLKCWDEILLLLHQYQDVAEEFYEIGEKASGFSVMTDVQSDIKVIKKLLIQDSLQQHDSQERFDDDLNEAKHSLEKGDYIVAKHRVAALRERHWNLLSNPQKSRCLSILGYALMQEGDGQQAGDLLIAAKEFAPNEEKALANESRGYLFKQDNETALAKSLEVLKLHPKNSVAISTFLASAPLDADFFNLQSYVPEDSYQDSEVASAVARRAMIADHCDLAIDLATRAIQNKADWSYPYLIRSQARVRKHITFLTHSEWPLVPESVKDDLLKAHADFTDTIQKAQADQNRAIQASALLDRGLLNSFFGKTREAEEDIEEAYRIDRNNVDVIRHYTGLLKSRGQLDRAIEILEHTVKSHNRSDILFHLALCLQRRGLSKDIAQAAYLYDAVAKDGTVPSISLRVDAALRALQCYSSSGTLNQAAKLIESVKSDISNVYYHGLLGRHELLSGNHDSASNCALKALSYISSSTEIDELEFTAALLSDVNLFREALTLWQRVVDTSGSQISYHRLIDCAIRLEEHGVAIEACEYLRQADLADSDLLHIEVDILQKYDVSRAIALIQEYLMHNPSDKTMRMRLSNLGVVYGHPEMVSGRLDDVPPASEMKPHLALAAIHVLRAGGNGLGAIRYGYEILHLHFDDPDAHEAFMAALHPGLGKVELPIFNVVKQGCAICYQEDGDTQDKWVVIEEELTPDPKLDEIPPDHELARVLMGKRIGEVFRWAEHAIRPRNGIIKGILNKYVFRYQRCMQEWQWRFPQKPMLQMIRVIDEQGDLDLSAIIKSLEKHEDRIRFVDDLYRHQLISLHMIAEDIGKTVIEVIIHLIEKEEPFIRCCNGTEAELNGTIESLKASKAIVLDLTAIASLALFADLSVLDAFPNRLLISQHTDAALGQKLGIMRRSLGTASGNMVLIGGQLRLVQDSDQVREQEIQKLEALIQTIKRKTEVMPCPGLASVSPKTRTAMLNGFGRYGAEAIILAKEPGHVLWTDDFAQAGFASKEFGVKRCWTQTALQWRTLAGDISPAVFAEISARLSGAGYYFTGLNKDILVAGARLSEWQVNRAPLNVILNNFGSQSFDIRQALPLAAVFIEEVFHNLYLPEAQSALIIKILEVLAKRPEGILCIEGMKMALPTIFGLNVIGLARAIEIIDTWLKQQKNLPFQI